jgi:hypothetical protein
MMNILLNFFLVFHTPLGFRGIALATASSVFIGSWVSIFYVKKLVGPGKRFSLKTVKKMAGVGWPIGLLQVLWQCASMVLFLILSTLPEQKVEILAALTTGLRIESAIYLPAFAFNLANAVVVGNLLGGKKEEEALRGGVVTAVIGVVIVTIMAIAVVLNARWIASLLSPNETVIRESTKYLYISMISEPFMAWGIILGGGLNGAGDTPKRSDQGSPQHLAGENPFKLYLCHPSWIRSRFGLVVHEPLPGHTGLPDFQEILQQEMVVRFLFSTLKAIGKTSHVDFHRDDVIYIYKNGMGLFFFVLSDFIHDASFVRCQVVGGLRITELKRIR